MPLTAMEQGDKTSGDLKQDGVCSIDVEKQTVGAVRVVPSSEKKQKKVYSSEKRHRHTH